MVLDAKYKRLGSYDKVSKVNPDDVHQVMAYMSALHVNKGGFIAPFEKRQERIPTSRILGTSSSLYIFGIEISKLSSSYADFCKQMKEKETTFVQSIKMCSAEYLNKAQ